MLPRFFLTSHRHQEARDTSHLEGVGLTGFLLLTSF